MSSNNKLKFAPGLLVYFPIVIGANLLLYFLGKMPNELFAPRPVDYVTTNLAIIIGLLLGYFIINWSIKRNKGAPIADERTISLMKNYLLIVVYFVFLISGIILLTLFFMGIETIEIGWIFFYLSTLIVLIAIGGFIVSRR